MTLTTHDRRLADDAQPPSTTSGRRSRSLVLRWGSALAAAAAVAVLAVALLHPHPASRSDDLARTIAAHGSVAAIDHRDQQRSTLRTATSYTVAAHGSVAAIDHRDRRASTG